MTTVFALDAELHVRSTQQSRICLGAFGNAHIAHRILANSRMIAPDTECFVGNNMQLDVLKEFRILRRQNILLDCQITVSTFGKQFILIDSIIQARDGETCIVHSALLAVNFLNLRAVLNDRSRIGNLKVELKRYPIQ